MPSALNKRIHGQPAGSIYVGRPSPWGNPFSHKTGTLAQFQVATRDEAVDRYEAWLRAQPALMARARQELAGKDLVCWCAPARCHAQVLIQVANEPASDHEVGPPTGKFRRQLRRT